MCKKAWSLKFLNLNFFESQNQNFAHQKCYLLQIKFTLKWKVGLFGHPFVLGDLPVSLGRELLTDGHLGRWSLSTIDLLVVHGYVVLGRIDVVHADELLGADTVVARDELAA